MLGNFKPVAFDPYRKSRSRWQLPPWALLLLTGIAAGALGLALVQERYLPPRLSADASAKLRGAYEQADAERQRLSAELGATTKRLETALADTKRLGDELGAARATVDRASAEMAAVVAALPPDPRGGSVEVRAARFTAKGGQLGYDVLLTRERAAGKALAGVMQLVASGASGRGAELTVNLKPVAITVGSYEMVRGSVALPDGFRPRQITIQLFDRIGGQALGMRVILVT